MGEWKVLLRLEKLTPTRLDNSVREEILQESLDSFRRPCQQNHEW